MKYGCAHFAINFRRNRSGEIPNTGVVEVALGSVPESNVGALLRCQPLKLVVRSRERRNITFLLPTFGHAGGRCFSAAELPSGVAHFWSFQTPVFVPGPVRTVLLILRETVVHSCSTAFQRIPFHVAAATGTTQAPGSLPSPVISHRRTFTRAHSNSGKMNTKLVDTKQDKTAPVLYIPLIYA